MMVSSATHEDGSDLCWVNARSTKGNKPPRNSGKDFHGNISQASDGPYQQSMGLDIGQVSGSPLLHLANVVELAPVLRDVFVQR